MVPQHSLDTQANTIYQVDVQNPPPPDPLDEIASEVPEHLKVLFLTTVKDSYLSNTLASDLKTLFQEHSSTFATGPTDIGYCDIIQHDIDTGGTYPLKQLPRRPPLSARLAEDDILDEMLQSGVIEPSQSAWASPVCLVKKKDGTYRFCVDYRRLNAVSKRDAFPIPDTHDALDHLRGCKYYATLDLLSGYWQLGNTERARERSAFCTRRGLFQFTRMPFGLAGALIGCLVLSSDEHSSERPPLEDMFELS